MISNLIFDCFRCFGPQNEGVIEDQTLDPNFDFQEIENIKTQPEQINEYAENIIKKVNTDIINKNQVRKRINSPALYEKVSDVEEVSLFIQSILHEESQEIIDRMTQFVETLYRLK
ncbi:MAG: hypothetical protein Q8K60_09075 [Parachlamydiaceae bacterium]|nr:hypothetical protein [Parachlamydiaceae bacterium]